MKMGKDKIVRAIKNGTGKALMMASLMGMMSMSVSAAGERELYEINKDVSITEYGVNLNAAGRIQYDENKDGNKDVYYDFKDYQKLGKSLATVDANEQELKTEYTRLYNLAEQNRKDLINTWNRFGIPQVALNIDAHYVTGSGTASIKGAMEAMPIHKFNEIRFNYDSRTHTASITYPDPWGGVGVYNGGQLDQNYLNQMLEAAYKQGKNDGEELVAAKTGRITVWNGVATTNTLGAGWDDKAGAQDDDKAVLLEGDNPEWVAKQACDFTYCQHDDESAYTDLYSSWSGWHLKEGSGSKDEGWHYIKTITYDHVIYEGHVTVYANKGGRSPLGTQKDDMYHVGNVYFRVKFQG